MSRQSQEIAFEIQKEILDSELKLRTSNKSSETAECKGCGEEYCCGETAECKCGTKIEVKSWQV